MIARYLPLLLLAATPALAQQAAPAPPVAPASPVAADQGGLSGSVTDDSAWHDLGIDIPSFATDADKPTTASAGSTAALGRAIAEVITADLKNNGLFKPVGPASLPPVSFAEASAPDFSAWAGRGAEMLVHGAVVAGADGQLNVGCGLYDVGLKQQLVRTSIAIGPADWRRAAHKCADTIYSRLSKNGLSPDSRE